MSATSPATTSALPASGRSGRRRRRWPYVLVVLVLLFGGGLVVADRVAVAVAQDRVAAKLDGRRPFSAQPTVRIHGIPFLTQAVGGRYTDIEASGPTQPLPTFGVVLLDAHLRGVHLKLDAVSNGVTDVPVDRADVRLSFPLSALAAASGIAGLTLTSNGTDVTGTAPLAVPGLGTVTVTARGQLTATGTQLQLRTVDVSVLGQTIPLPAGIAANALGFTLSLASLPYNAQIDAVTAVNGTVTLAGHASDIVLS